MESRKKVRNKSKIFVVVTKISRLSGHESAG